MQAEAYNKRVILAYISNTSREFLLTLKLQKLHLATEKLHFKINV